MPVNTSAFDAAFASLTAQVAETETVSASAVALINGFATAITKAVTDALTADNAADQATIDAATAAIEGVRTRFAASEDALGAAVLSSTPQA